MLQCVFYATPARTEPVRAWLKGLPKEVRRMIGADIDTVQNTWPIGKPLVDGFGGGLYEIRTTFGTNEYRIFFCISNSTIHLLHGFQKKTQKTTKADLDLAKTRQKEQCI